MKVSKGLILILIGVLLGGSGAYIYGEFRIQSSQILDDFERTAMTEGYVILLARAARDGSFDKRAYCYLSHLLADLEHNHNKVRSIPLIEDYLAFHRGQIESRYESLEKELSQYEPVSSEACYD